MHVIVHKANESDTKAGFRVFQGAFQTYPTLLGASVDEGYRHSFELDMDAVGKTVTISKKDKTAWHILPQRWIVERSFAWLNGFRRLSKDFEKLICSAEAMIKMTNIMRLIKFL